MSKLIFSLIVGSQLLAGCVTPVTLEQIAKADYGIVPPNYKEVIQNHMYNVLIDPYSAHYRFFNEPVKGYAYVSGTINPPEFGYIILVGVNAKNRMGGYTGEKTYRFFFKGDRFWILPDYTKVEIVK